ncbi:MAG: response regulator [bacterium]|nr:response regulator [bacterium]
MESNEKKKILIVEDNVEIHNLYREILKRHQYEVEIQEDVSGAIEALKNKSFDLVILDLQLPGKSGMSFFEEIRNTGMAFPPVIVCTGLASIENAVDAMKHGASDFITKPFTIETLLTAVERNIRINEISKKISEIDMIRSILELNKIIISITDIDELCNSVIDLVYNLVKPDAALLYLKDEDTGRFFLRRTKGKSGNINFPIVLSLPDVAEGNVMNYDVFQRTDDNFLEIKLFGKKDVIGILMFHSKEKLFENRDMNILSVFGTQIGIALENARLVQQLQDSYISSIRSLVNSLEAKDAYTKNHSEQVAYYAVAIGKALGLNGNALESLRNAAYLHDIGKLGIKDEIISKRESLSDEEFEIIKKHPLITKEILKPLKIKREEIEACIYHHEKFNGTGYPEGLSGEQIPLMARILAVADALSAMISERPYRKKMEMKHALEELKKNSGKQFDGRVVSALIGIIEGSKEKGEFRDKEIS